MKTNDVRDYQKNGYLIRPFKNTETKKELFSVLKEIKEERLKPGFSFQAKPSSFRKDLVPNVYDYSNVFLDILAENNIKQLVSQSIGPDVDLINIALVDSIPPGYMTGWHSDNFEVPIHKIIIYPRFNEPAEKRLEVLEGHVKSKNRFLYNKYIQKIEPKLFQHHTKAVYSSDDDFLFVNTQVFHRAFEVTEGSKGALRVLYSFRKQFKNMAEKERYLEASATTIADIDKLVEKYKQLA